MSDPVTYGDFVRMIQAAAAEIRANHEMLSKLDSVGGDGDHGTTIVRAMACAEKAIADESTGQLKALASDIGWAIMGVDGGATGPLLGTLFMGMADAFEGRDMADAATVAGAFADGLCSLQQQTKARVGDKTLLDALVPAVTALCDAADAGQSAAAALEAAAEAAARGAESTTALQARFGRARSIKEASVGSKDPGATSISLLFRGFADALR